MSKSSESSDDVALVCPGTKTDLSIIKLPVKEEEDALKLLKDLVESNKAGKGVLEASSKFGDQYWTRLEGMSETLLKQLVLEAKEWVKTNGAEEEVLTRVVELRSQIFAEVEEIQRAIPNIFVSAIPYAEFNEAKALLERAAWATPKLADSMRMEAKELLHFMPTGFDFKNAIVVSKRWSAGLAKLDKALAVVGFAPGIVDLLQAKTKEETIKAFRELAQETGEALTGRAIGAVLGVLIEGLLISEPVGWLVLAVYIGGAQIASSKLGDLVGKLYFGPRAEKIARSLMRIPKPEVASPRP